MVNKKFWLGILVMVLVFGMSVVGCDDGSKDGGTDTALNGTWVLTTDNLIAELKMNNGNYENSNVGISYYIGPTYKGTFTTSGDKITFTTTHVYGASIGLESKWYSKNELDTNYHNVFTTSTSTYSINGNTLTCINENGQRYIWSRK